jgi:hypothetical protein
MEGLGGMQYQGFAEINANANVAAQGRLIASASIQISGSALIAANGFKFGEEWTVDTAEDNTWTAQSAGDTNWTTQNAGSDTWTSVNADSNTWTVQNTGNNEWQRQG